MKLSFQSRRERDDAEEEQDDSVREPRRSSLQKKRDAIVRTYEEPVLPKLCKILWISMFVVTAVLLMVEVNEFLRYFAHLGIAHFLTNLSTTGLGIWGVYTLLLAAACAAGIRTNTVNFRNRQRESGVADRTEEDRARSARAIRRLNTAYWRYLKISLSGLALWLAFYLVVRLIPLSQ